MTQICIFFTLLITLSTKMVANCGVSYPLPPHVAGPYSVCFSPDNAYLVSANTNSSSTTLIGSVTVFSLSEGTLQSSASYQLINSATIPASFSFSPGGQSLAIPSYYPGGVVIFDVIDGTLSNGILYEPNVFQPSSSGGGDWGIVAATFSPDGAHLAAVNIFGAAIVFTVTDGTLSDGVSYPMPDTSSQAISVHFSPNGRFLAIANGSSNKVTLFSISEGTLSQGTSYLLPTGSTGPQDAVFSPDGTLLVTSNSLSNDITIFNVSESGILSGGTSSPLPADSLTPNGVSFTPDGSYLIASNSQSNDITVFSLSGNTIVNTISYPLPSGSLLPSGIAVSPNGLYIATADLKSNQVTLFDASCLGIIPTTSTMVTTSSSSTPTVTNSAPISTTSTTATQTSSTSMVTSSSTTTESETSTSNSGETDVTSVSASTDSTTTLLSTTSYVTGTSKSIAATTGMLTNTDSVTTTLTTAISLDTGVSLSTGVRHAPRCGTACIPLIASGALIAASIATTMAILTYRKCCSENIFPVLGDSPHHSRGTSRRGSEDYQKL